MVYLTETRYAPVDENQKTKKPRRKKTNTGCMDCLERIPYASLISAILTCVGAGVFCGAFYEGIKLTSVNIFTNLFKIKYQYIYWLDYLRYVGIILAVVMVAIAMLFLVFGFLATGATRRHIYSGPSCIMGGRVGAGFFLVIGYLLNFGWIMISGILVLPIAIYWMVHQICFVEVEQQTLRHPGMRDAVTYCFNLSQMGVYHNTTLFGGENHLCGDNLKHLCSYVNKAGPWYVVAYCGAIVMILGLSHFLISLAVNYVKIKMSKEMTEYRNAADLCDGHEFSIINDRKSQF